MPMSISPWPTATKNSATSAALSCAQTAVEHNPDDFLAHTSLSIFYQRKGMIPEAEKEKAIAAQLQSGAASS